MPRVIGLTHLLQVPESEDRVHQSTQGLRDDYFSLPPRGVPHV